MVNRALGLIEVSGMLHAISAADAAMKAANVELLGNRRIRGGLTTVQLLGDVAAVRAAVDAGVETVMNTDSYVSSHVIPRLDEQVERMLMQKYQTKEPSTGVSTSVSSEMVEKPKIKEEVLEELTVEPADPSERDIKKVLEENQTDGKPQGETPFKREDLEKLKVVELRSIAYELNIDRLTKKEIKYANKETLIQALLKKGVEDE